jgi:hypothetical protein
VGTALRAFAHPTLLCYVLAKRDFQLALFGVLAEDCAIVTINIQAEDSAIFKRLKSNGRITHRLRRLMTQQWNKCSVCGSHITEGRPAFAGYDSKSDALLVGTCCASELQELATPVYWSNSLNLSVHDSQAVWRYMDFAKFVAMLQQKGLYLSRADRFDDRFEGATGVTARQTNWDEYYLDYVRKLVVTPPAGYPIPQYTAEQIEAQANRLLKSMKFVALDARQLLVNCWHGGEGEAEALWRLYSPPGTSGVAIRSTVGNLWDACEQYDRAIVGRVHYVDFRCSFASIQTERIFQKRRTLSHEKEVRMVLPNERQSPVDGKILACDLEKLISEVVISPFAPSWSFDVISDILRRYEYSFDLKQSELLDEPFF